MTDFCNQNIINTSLQFLFLVTLTVDNKICKGVRYVACIIAMIFTTILFYVIININLGLLDLTPQFSKYWVTIVLGTTPTSWSFESNVFLYYLVLSSGILASLLTVFKKNKAPLFVLLLLGVYLYFFSFHFARYNKPRYAFIMLIWMTPILSYGLDKLIKFGFTFLTRSNPLLKTTVICFVVLTTFNPVNTLNAISLSTNGYVPITNEYHYNIKPIITKYETALKEADAVICSICSPFIWYGVTTPINNKLWSTYDDNHNNVRHFEDQITKYPAVWIFIDQRSYPDLRYVLDKSDTMIAHKPIKFVEVNNVFDL